jgi:site-specific DNA-methyltransferase (adenine-specific)
MPFLGSIGSKGNLILQRVLDAFLFAKGVVSEQRGIGLQQTETHITDLNNNGEIMLNKALFLSNREDWETPQRLFDELNNEFGFTLDVCATPETAKCAKYYTPSEDGPTQDWTGEVVFCNPPYGRKQDAWIQKCSAHGAQGGVAVMLLPVRTDTVRFHDMLHGKAEIRFLRGRLKFGKAKHSAPFPSMVFVFRKGSF